MKYQIKLSPAISEMVALCYQGMSAAQEYARQITADPNCQNVIACDFRHIASSLSTPIDRIDKRIPKATRAHFNDQIKNNDHIRLDNVKSLYIRMLPVQQDMIETLMQGILKGEVIDIDFTEKKLA